MKQEGETETETEIEIERERKRKREEERETATATALTITDITNKMKHKIHSSNGSQSCFSSRLQLTDILNSIPDSDNVYVNCLKVLLECFKIYDKYDEHLKTHMLRNNDSISKIKQFLDILIPGINIKPIEKLKHLGVKFNREKLFLDTESADEIYNIIKKHFKHKTSQELNEINELLRDARKNEIIEIKRRYWKKKRDKKEDKKKSEHKKNKTKKQTEDKKRKGKSSLNKRKRERESEEINKTTHIPNKRKLLLPNTKRKRFAITSPSPPVTNTSDNIQMIQAAKGDQNQDHDHNYEMMTQSDETETINSDDFMSDNNHGDSEDSMDDSMEETEEQAMEHHGPDIEEQL